MVKVAGIDQSRDGFGWAIGTDELDDKPKWGVEKLGMSSSNEGMIYATAAKRVRTLIEWGAEKVFFEEPIHLPTDKLQLLYLTIGVPAIIMLTCQEAGVPCACVPIDEWRNRFLGTKRAPPGLNQRAARTSWFKDKAISTCLQRGWLVEDHNAAEALGIMDYGLCCVSRKYLTRTGPIHRRAQGRTQLL
jgi:hypothetical protein